MDLRQTFASRESSQEAKQINPIDGIFFYVDKSWWASI